MAVGTLEEIIDDNHAIVSNSVGSEYYVNMLSFVDKDLIEPGCTVLLNNKVRVLDYIVLYIHVYIHLHVHGWCMDGLHVLYTCVCTCTCSL